jgi:DNA-binding PadR family transcriptional regulator
VLALLAEEPTHGFAVARAMEPEGEVGKIWSLRRPLVYRAVETLTAMELVRPAATVPSRSGPQRTVLQVTPNGKRADALAEPARRARPRRALAC